MFRWTAFPFLRFALALALGVLLAHYFPGLWARSFAAVYLLAFLLGVALMMARRSYLPRPLAIGSFGLLLIGYLGGLTYKLDEDRRWSSHYTQFSEISAFSMVVAEPPESTASGWRTTGDVRQVLSRDTLREATGMVQVYVRTKEPFPEEGDVIYVQGSILPFRKPGNPNQFDYGRYMARDYVYGQAFAGEKQYLFVARKRGWSIGGSATDIRQAIENDLSDYFRYEESKQIALALLVGVKDDLGADLREAYAAAGATHVLAVSGLHVGIVYLLLLWVFGRLRKVRHGKVVFVVCVVLCIWLYALVTGLSASVFRAATMFTVLAFGEASGNDRNIYNTLGISAFVLLLYRPAYLFDLGFQFSYLAVFGIVYLYPKINGWIVPRSRLVSQAWNATSVSLAAQVAVAPLSIYYFHQFPTYFLLTNLIVVVFAFLILLIGLPMLVLGALIPWLGALIAVPLEWIILALNEIIRGIEGLPGSTLTGLSIGMIQVILLYGTLVTFLWSVEYRKFVAFVMAAVLLVAFMFRGYAKDLQSEERTALVIYDVREGLGMDIQRGGEAIYIGDSLPTVSIARSIDPARMSWGYSTASEQVSQATRFGLAIVVVFAPLNGRDRESYAFGATLETMK